MLDELKQKFLWQQGRTQADRVLPSSLLHNETGLRMWAQITQLPDYYQTDDEIDLLNTNGKELAQELGEMLQDHNFNESLTLIDLGCG
jgi:uncharacterized SAM-dependent methyltransferase